VAGPPRPIVIFCFLSMVIIIIIMIICTDVIPYIRTHLMFPQMMMVIIDTNHAAYLFVNPHIYLYILRSRSFQRYYYHHRHHHHQQQQHTRKCDFHMCPFYILQVAARGCCSYKLTWTTNFIESVAAQMRQLPMPVPVPLQSTSATISSSSLIPSVKMEQPFVPVPSAATTDVVAVRVKTDPVTMAALGSPSSQHPLDEITMMDESESDAQMPHVAGDVMKGLLLEQYNRANEKTIQLETQLKHIRAQIQQKAQESGKSGTTRWADAVRTLEQTYQEATRERETRMKERDDALTELIALSPMLSGQYRRMRDPESSHFKPVASHPQLMTTILAKKHAKCASIEAAISALQVKRLENLKASDVAVEEEDFVLVNELSIALDAINADMIAQDELRSKEFLQITLLWEQRLRDVLEARVKETTTSITI
jgi:hypothetical protein